MLNFFPELFKYYTAFTMKPKVKAGYTERMDVSRIRGVIQNVKSGFLGIQADSISDLEYPTLWTRNILSKEHYIESADGTVYRRIKSAGWTSQGSFNVYMLEVVVGVDGRQTVEEAVDYGVTKYL